MSLLVQIITALGLSMDAFAVAITSGILIKNLRVIDALKIGLFFGLFQAIMPLLGWLVGIKFSDYIIHIDHWIAFFILSIIGLKMIHESRKDEKNEKTYNPLNNKILLILAIATSIDALAVGVGFSFLQIPILSPVLIIGIITFILSTVGVIIGNKSGVFFKNKAEFLGGIILIIIGFNILFEHLGIKLHEIFMYLFNK